MNDTSRTLREALRVHEIAQKSYRTDYQAITGLQAQREGKDTMITKYQVQADLIETGKDYDEDLYNAQQYAALVASKPSEYNECKMTKKDSTRDRYAVVTIKKPRAKYERGQFIEWLVIA